MIKEYKNSDKVIDLHTHTIYSDGEFTPKELIEHAIKNNVGILAITDHDTIEGIKKVDYSDPLIVDSGIKIIKGIELSAKVDKGQMHILGLNIDIKNKELNDKMSVLRNNSTNSFLAVNEQVKKDYNIEFSKEDIENLVNSNRNLGRPDLARLCVKYGYTHSIQDAFDKYLIPAYDKIRKFKKGISYQECIELILSSDGIPVLAHPKTLKLSDKEFLILLKDMIKCGLKGIEVYHSSFNEEDTKKYLNIASEFNLLTSGGSDYHGINTKPNVKLGSGINNNLKIKKLTVLDKIKNM